MLFLRGGILHKIMERWAIMQKPNKQRKTKAAHTPLTLRGWIYAADGKHIKELIHTSFLEFYFAKQTGEIRQNA